LRDYIPCFAADYGDVEKQAAAYHFLHDPFITAHKHVNEFEQRFKERVGRKHAVMVNSGSSAVMVAVAAMEWKPGTKVITPAVTFATTVAPLLQQGLEPVFVDVEEGTYNIDPQKMVDTIIRTGANACIIPHTLGNPVDPKVWAFCGSSIEDACDALDSTVDGRNCGTFADLSCFSFFAAHHITTGQGGMVLANDDRLGRLMYKYASWGRDCWCRAGQDNLCKNRFDYEIDGVEYDHKYIFSVPGYNVAPLDVCGVIGKLQLAKADGYKRTRQRNFSVLDTAFADLDGVIVRPKSLPGADVNWFGYPITLKRGSRKAITRRIEARGVATRLMFGGNITRQPMFRGVKIDAPFGLEQSDRVMQNTFICPLNHTLSLDEIYKVATVVYDEVLRG
jgi:CDP-6-deoxy-D-xylo-4-hexulose-3-dehydrase